MGRTGSMIGLALAAALAVGCSSSGQGTAATGASTTLTGAAPGAASAAQQAVADHMMERAAARDFAGAERDFDATMAKGLDPTKLGEAWGQLEAANGTFQRYEGSTSGSKDGYVVITYRTAFAKQTRQLQVTVSADAKVAGFYVTG